MPNYHLVTQRKDKSYNFIEFSKIEKYKDLNDKKLSDIIHFTGYFIEETDLKDNLLKLNLIKDSEYNDRLAIIYKYNGAFKKLMYGITYNEDLEFFDVNYIKEYIISREFNPDFLEGLCNRYRNNYGQQVNTQNLYNFINYVRLQKYDDILDKDLKNDIETTIGLLVNREVYNYKNNKKIINYRGLRDLAMYLAYHRNKNRLIKKEEKINNEINNNDKPKVKKIKKNKNIDGQLTFQDMGWK